MGKPPGRKKKTMVSWEVVCKPIMERGLGIRAMESQMNALHMKLAWLAYTDKSQWSQLIEAKYKEWTIMINQIKGLAGWAKLKRACIKIRKLLK